MTNQVLLVPIFGVPAVGKTTVMKNLRALYGADAWKPWVSGRICRGIAAPDLSRVMVGVFDGRTFEGTDALAMNVAPVFVKLIQSWQKLAAAPRVVFFEGDRLCNGSLFNQWTGHVMPFCIEADPKDITARHEMRQDDQPENFLKAKYTKVENLKKLLSPTVLFNEHGRSDVTALAIRTKVEEWASNFEIACK